MQQKQIRQNLVPNALAVALLAGATVIPQPALSRPIGQPGVETIQGVDAGSGIATRIWVLPEGGSEKFAVRLTNESGAVESLSFNRAAYIQVVVRDSSGNVVWNSLQAENVDEGSGANRVSINAAGSFGSTIFYDTVWTPNALPAGELRAEFTLLTSVPIALGTLAFSGG